MFYATLILMNLRLVVVNSASFRQGLWPEEVCETKECYDAAAHIKKWMNPAFKPCEDFYEFSCGYWHNPGDTTENKVHNRSIGSRDNIIKFHLKNFLLDENIVEESRLFKLLRKFLSLCLDEESIEARGVSPAVEALKKVGGWPVLEQDWCEDNWSIEDTELAFGGNVFFNLQILHGTNGTLAVIVMRSDYRLISIENLIEGFQNESVREYYERSVEFAEAFGAERSKAETDMRESLEFEIAIAELVMGLNRSSDGAEDITLSKLQEYISWINWDYLLTRRFPESVSFKKNDTIYITNFELLRDIGDLISKHPKRTVANYVMWKTLLTLREYLPAKVSNITDVLIEDGPVYKNRYEQCVTLVEKSSVSGAVASYLARQTVEDTKAAKEMTQNILNEFLLDISELEWLDEKTRSTAVKALRETKILISFPEEVLDLNILEDVYKEVKINTSTFFEAVMDSNKWIRKSEFENLGRSTAHMTLKEKIETALSINAYFNMVANEIVITGGFLHFLPLFSSKVPAYVNYGHLGGIVAHELTHALDIQTDESDTDNRVGDKMAEYLMERWGSNETEEIYDAKKQCIIDQYCAFNDSKYTGQQLNGNQTEREDVADNGGFKLALRAYRRMASNLVSPEPRLPTLQQYSPEQMFIISLSNAYCEIPEKLKLSSQIEYDSHSPFEFRVKGMMMNSPDFSKLFHCEVSDPMNPVEKCEVW